jgi:predicted metal-dependent phosphoesterase TrpH
LIGLFIREAIPQGLTLFETLHRISDQGGIAIAAHPTARGSSSLSASAIHNAFHSAADHQSLVGIETLNASLINRKSFRNAETIAKRHNLSFVGSSDAHTLSMIGNGVTIFEGNTAQDLRKGLIERNTKSYCSQLKNPAIVLLDWFRAFLLRKSGWVQWNQYPDAPVVFRREKQLSLEGHL